MIYLKGHFFSLTKMTIVIIWQFFLVSELNSCERRIFLVYFYCHMSTLRIKWETYITRDRQILLVHCVENSLNFKMSYDIWKLTKCSSTYNHLFTVLSFLRKLITIPMGGKGLRCWILEWKQLFWIFKTDNCKKPIHKNLKVFLCGKL